MKTYIEQIDVMKGVAILLVVVGHIIQFSPRMSNGDFPIYQWIYSYHMDVFFFCSGFLLHGLNLNENTKGLLQFIKKKILRLIVPCVTWSAIIYMYDKQKIDMQVLLNYFIYSPKCGLWFLQSLFLDFVVISVILFLLSYVSYNLRNRMELFFLLSLVLLSISMHHQHFSFFIWGVFFSRNENYREILLNKYVALFASLLYVLSLLLDELPSYVVASSAIVFFYNIRPQKLLKVVRQQLVLFGKHSMAIFLLHFFIVLEFGEMDLSARTPVVNFIIYSVIAIFISYICIIVYSFTRSGLLSLLLWGENK